MQVNIAFVLSNEPNTAVKVQESDTSRANFPTIKRREPLCAISWSSKINTEHWLPFSHFKWPMIANKAGANPITLC
jgi:hypothetical protein